MTPSPPFPASGPRLFEGPWEVRLQHVISLVREMSQQNDPQMMVQRYAARIRQMMPNDGIISVSRRDLQPPAYRITRSPLWGIEHNPWKKAATLPVFDRGILGEWLYSQTASVFDDLRIDPADPAFEHLRAGRSFMVLPTYDEGVVKNMTVVMHRQPGHFLTDVLPEQVWISNLFGRVTHNLVLRDQLKRAYEAVDRELQTVGDIQRSLLPDKLPPIPGLNLAAHYLTSRRAGGDYYDFFPLSDGRWGFFIADVAGHGTPAAVLMAVTHSIAHGHPGDPDPPSRLLTHVNRQLAQRYTNGTGTFVTAFYAIYDPATRNLTYSCAGHPEPRLRTGRVTQPLDVSAALGLPLGIMDTEVYTDSTRRLEPGDALVLFTDGITESKSPQGELFGVERLDDAIDCCTIDTELMVRSILLSVEEFTDSAAPNDDQTLIVAKVL